MIPNICHAPGADLALAYLASLLELQDVASRGSETSGLAEKNLQELNDSLKKPTPRSKLRGTYGFLPFGTGRRPTRCFLGTLQRAAGNDQVQAQEHGLEAVEQPARTPQSVLPVLLR